MKLHPDTKLGDVVARYPTTVPLLERARIDYCCGGQRTIATACAQAGVPVQSLLAELERASLAPSPPDLRDWTTAPLAELVDYLLLHHHAKLREELPRLVELARKVQRVHDGKTGGRLAQLLDVVHAIREDVLQHLPKEELVLFPAILAGAGPNVGGPIGVMEHEHALLGNHLRDLRRLADDFVPPEEACASWRALYAGLAELEADLHEHVHLENNVLHVRALAASRAS